MKCIGYFGGSAIGKIFYIKYFYVLDGFSKNEKIEMFIKD